MLQTRNVAVSRNACRAVLRFLEDGVDCREDLTESDPKPKPKPPRP